MPERKNIKQLQQGIYTSSKKKLLLLLLFDIFFLRELCFLLEGRAMPNDRFHNILKREIITHNNKSKTGPQDGQRT